MIIVSDTTPLRYLIEIEEIQIIERLFGRVIIPRKVSEELRGRRTPPTVKAWIQSPPAWLEIREADISLFVPLKPIHEGEREAIALALQLNADALLCDDRDAISEAERLSIPTVRLFNILERAAERDLLDLPEALDKMSRTTFYAPPYQIIDAMLERDAQRKTQTGQQHHHQSGETGQEPDHEVNSDR
jgi:predicted nucleic acid-binding protein